MTSPDLIRIENLSKSYRLAERLIPVLNQINLLVEPGEMLAILGASGSGKSTLMNIIGLLDQADSGSYALQGDMVTQLTEDQQAATRNRCMGFVFQQFNLLSRLTAEQNVALPLQYAGWVKESIFPRVRECLKKVGMEAYLQHLPSQLSGGQQQRVAIARALVNRPQILLADEPTGALDSKTGQEVMELFHALHSEGTTIIIITHDLAVAKQCQRRMLMVDGCLRESCDAAV